MATLANANAQPEYEEEPIEAGCPMLIHAAASNPVDSSRAFMRCALGWSVFSALSQARCSATHLVENCWREHPEKTPIVEVEPVVISFQSGSGKAAAD